MNSKFKDVKLNKEVVLDRIQKNFRTNRNVSNMFAKGVYARFKQTMSEMEVEKGIVNDRSR